MHKIFAKPVFLGKKVVFLPQCHSTNEEMVQMVRKDREPEGLVVYTDHQLTGRGQRGNHWVAEPEKNILMSVLLRPHFLAPADQHLLNLITALSVGEVLESLVDLPVKLKWPNDVYVGSKKIAGILIESSIRGIKTDSAVVGIGLNVFQSDFEEIPATSLTIEGAEEVNRFELMEEILRRLEAWYRKLKAGRHQDIRSAYHEKLLWRNESRVFSKGENEFTGEITGIDPHGRLLVKSKGEEQTYNLKEIRFIR